VPAPGDYDHGKIGGMIGRGNRSTGRKPAMSTTNPTCYPDANPGGRGGKPATNRLSYSTAYNTPYISHRSHYTYTNSRNSQRNKDPPIILKNKINQ
jgi:hypothetical protein